MTRGDWEDKRTLKYRKVERRRLEVKAVGPGNS